MKAQGKKRLLLTDDHRRLLAVKGKSLGRKALMELTTIVTPDTILRWHRNLVAEKWDHNDQRKKVGRPRIRQVIVDLILRFAQRNPTWGYDRIQGALANVGYHISDQTVGNVLKEHGIEPAPKRKRKTTWKTLHQVALGRPGRDRLHHRGSLDQGRIGHVLPVVRDGSGHTTSPLRRLHTQSARAVDETNGQESHGSVRRVLAGQTLRVPRRVR